MSCGGYDGGGFYLDVVMVIVVEVIGNGSFLVVCGIWCAVWFLFMVHGMVRSPYGIFFFFFLVEGVYMIFVETDYLSVI